MRHDRPETVLAVIRVDSGDCGACAEEIRTAVNGVRGINDIRIDAIRRRILVLYNGDPLTLDGVLLSLRSLGMDASLFPIPCLPLFAGTGAAAGRRESVVQRGF